ncbi:hypothetical protein K9N68_16950 [Kovacikia minuta CCNUW1]|uniref:hypothetical protein n=1 Tax=Kovacikia minuta TaxID=2931930 RepID=UPI001CCD0626|nr:hypothetical protein [Kovacikia minuta]UBF29370.1 hypothetical protein K9N68_16950 [Kovacikia minuta CCNUW1]
MYDLDWRACLAASHLWACFDYSINRFKPATTMIRLKTAIPILLVLTLIFVGFGDQFLPQPLKGASYKTRTALNQMMESSFKVWQPKSKPYGRTEKALEDAEKGKN